MITVINYSDDRFKLARDYNTKTAYQVGRADRVIEYTPETLPEEIKGKYPKWSIQNDRIIGRYGLWRPYIVLDALSQSEDGDYVCYSDAGLYFIKPIQLLIDQMVLDGSNIMLFGLPFIEKQWTKRDVFIFLDADCPEYKNTNQIMSTIFIAKKCDETVAFFQEYKEIAEKAPELFTDEDNIYGKENDSCFISNRHNQSVLSVLAKKHHIKEYRDPSEYGIKPLLYKHSVPEAIFKECSYRESLYPQIIVHHRSKSIRMDVRLFAFFRRNLSPYIAIKLFKFGHEIKYAFQSRKWG